MNRAWAIAVAAFAASALVVVCLLMAAFAAATDLARENRSKAEKLSAHCAYVRNAMRMDWRELQLPELQERASERFYENVTGHSVMEIIMCATTPVDLRRHDVCFLTKDYACLAELAKTAELAIQIKD